MKVLLLKPKVLGNPWIPLGLASIAAFIRKEGIEVKIVDANVVDLNKDKLALIIKTFKPEIIGTGGMTIQYGDVLNIGALVKSVAPQIPLVYGGVHFTFFPQDGLKYGDICVFGEGEETFLEICGETDRKKIKGIAFKEDKEIIRTEERPLIPDLDKIPFPAYDLLNINAYKDYLITREKAISMMTGRGCPYNCVFCASPQLWKRKVRVHSLEYVFEHIDLLIKNYSLKNLRIMDDTFTLNKKRVYDFCDKIEEHRFKLKMTCLTNVRNADYDLFKRMKEVGFAIVAFGIESGNNEILQKINKGITIEEARKAVEMAKKAGLRTELLFMVGNIGETKQTIIDSIKLANKLNPIGSNFDRWYQIRRYNVFQFATPSPGSKFNEIAKDYGTVVDENYEGYNHTRPVFIPHGLDEKTMIKLQDIALLWTNKYPPKWLTRVTKTLKEQRFLKFLYKKLLNRFE
ncbi:MAG: B12-binding domain-containing radical SAM protein [Candidatus Helarchaeota archaeon]|nr:B12-binding domain-containing radical SAM protein [Candidatus Helarchaeota archaeon]